MSDLNESFKKIDALKEEIDAFRPLTPHELTQLREYYRVGLAYASNALEGNSLTESETKIVIEDGVTIGGKPLQDHLEAIGHSEAYDHLLHLVGNESFTEDDVRRLHYVLYNHIDAEKAGNYRSEQVFITGTDFIPPSPKDVPKRMGELFGSLPTSRSTRHPVEFAALLHKELVTIHPFIDGNGRTARLVMNLALLQAGYPITIIPPILRAEYIATLKRAQTKPNDDTPFVDFIARAVHEGQKERLRLLNALG